MRKQLRGRVDASGLTKRVFFIDEPENFKALLSAVDLQLMHPDSLYAKMDLPLAILEGMSYGIPVVKSDLPSLNEVFDHDQAGATIKPGDAGALARAVCELVDDADLRKERGRAARDIVAERFSQERMARAYADLYREFD